MERQVFLRPSFTNTGPKRLSLRDDGNHSIEDASYPPSADHLIFRGTSAKISCYQNPAVNDFILWETNSATPHRRVLYHPNDNLPHMAVCFGHSAEGQTKIVLLAAVATTIRVKVHTVAGRAGADSGGVLDANGRFLADATWSTWIEPAENINFLPDLQQPALFSNGNATMYFYGHVLGQPMIMTFNVETQDIGTQDPPPYDGIHNARFALGFGFDGEVSAALFQPAEAGHDILTVWGLRNGVWEHVVEMMLHEPRAANVVYPCMPLCFFQGRTDGRVLHYNFLLNGRAIIRVKAPVPVNIPAQVETLHTLPRPVMTSNLPPAHYVSEANRKIGDGRRPAGQERPRNLTVWQKDFMGQFDDDETEL